MIEWRSLFPSCFRGPAVSPAPKPSPQKGIVAKQRSFQRISFSDLSNPTSPLSPEDLSLSLVGSNLYVFTLQELRAITQNFSSSNFIGEGGFGPVHKGFVDEKLRPGLKGQPVAVKLLDLEGTQGHREWLTEVIFLGQLRHHHLVKLIGYCCEDEHRVIVYEYMSKGSLEHHLFRRFAAALPWSARLKIAVGAAKGLTFLHEAEKPVIYRDFKASNILLDSELNDARKLSRIMDPKLDSQYSPKAALKAAALAYQCLIHNPRKRPTMSEVVKTLEPLQDIKDDIPIGPFVYTVATENSKDEDVPKAVAKENGNERAHHGRRHRLQATPPATVEDGNEDDIRKTKANENGHRHRHHHDGQRNHIHSPPTNMIEQKEDNARKATTKENRNHHHYGRRHRIHSPTSTKAISSYHSDTSLYKNDFYKSPGQQHEGA